MAKAPSPAMVMDRMAGLLGGRGFAGVLTLSALFSLALFYARADLFALPASVAHAGKEDFIAFWRAAVLMLQGEAAQAYDPVAFRDGLADDAQGLLFLNPPQFFLLLWPFGLFSYGAAKALWIALNLGALGAVAALAGKGRLQAGLFALFLILSPAAFGAFLPLQLAPLVAAGFLAALLIAKDRPLLSGLLFALLTAKPQYALLAPVFLAARGEWQAFAAAAAFSLGFAALSWLVLGTGTWAAFFEAVGGQHVPHAAANMRDAFTLHQTVGKLGGGALLKIIVQAGAILICGFAVWGTARRWPREAAAGFALIASTFVAPSLWAYDWPLFAAGLFLLARAHGRWPMALQGAAALLWIAPLISLGVGTMASSLAAPAITAAALATLYFTGTPVFAAACSGPAYSGSAGTSSSCSGNSPS